VRPLFGSVLCVFVIILTLGWVAESMSDRQKEPVPLFSKLFSITNGGRKQIEISARFTWKAVIKMDVIKWR